MIRFAVVLLSLMSVCIANQARYDNYRGLAQQMFDAAPSARDSDISKLKDQGFSGDKEVAESNIHTNPDAIEDRVKDFQRRADSKSDDDRFKAIGQANEIINTSDDKMHHIDGDNPLIKKGDKITADPMAYLTGAESVTVEDGIKEYSEHECEDSGDAVDFTSNEQRIIIPDYNGVSKKYLQTRISGVALRPSSGANPFNHGMSSFAHDMKYDYIVKDESLRECNLEYYHNYKRYSHTVIHEYQAYKSCVVNFSYHPFGPKSKTRSPINILDLSNHRSTVHAGGSKSRPCIDMHFSSSGLPSGVSKSDVFSVKVNFTLYKPRSDYMVTLDSLGNFNYNTQVSKEWLYDHESGGNRANNSATVLYRAKPTNFHEKIIGINTELEQLVTDGICERIAIDIVEGRSTKEFFGKKFDREWWNRRIRYRCKIPIDKSKSCALFRAKGCMEHGTPSCLHRINGICVKHKRKYRCVQSVGDKKVNIGGAVPFCLDGNCDDHSYAPNEDFADAMTRLQMLADMGEDWKNLADKKNLKLVKGEALHCDENKVVGTNFRNCCTTLGGWGEMLGATCSENEKTLARKRSSDMCVQVGSPYCVETAPLLGCIRYRKQFCCFGSKLLKILQVEGRKQLSIGWGSAKCPDCRGFTSDELGKIDLGKIDFSEALGDIQRTPPSHKKLSTDFLAPVSMLQDQNNKAKISQSDLPSKDSMATQMKKQGVRPDGY